MLHSTRALLTDHEVRDGDIEDEREKSHGNNVGENFSKEVSGDSIETTQVLMSIYYKKHSQ